MLLSRPAVKLLTQVESRLSSDRFRDEYKLQSCTWSKQRVISTLELSRRDESEVKPLSTALACFGVADGQFTGEGRLGMHDE